MQKKLETFLPLFPNKRVFSYFVLEESGECLISIFFNSQCKKHHRNQSKNDLFSHLIIFSTAHHDLALPGAPALPPLGSRTALAG